MIKLKGLLHIQDAQVLAQDDKYAEFSNVLHIQDAQDPPKMYLTRFGGPHTKTFFKDKKTGLERSCKGRKLVF